MHSRYILMSGVTALLVSGSGSVRCCTMCATCPLSAVTRTSKHLHPSSKPQCLRSKAQSTGAAHLDAGLSTSRLALGSAAFLASATLVRASALAPLPLASRPEAAGSSALATSRKGIIQHITAETVSNICKQGLQCRWLRRDDSCARSCMLTYLISGTPSVPTWSPQRRL